ncbi:MAG: hypothetical protein M3044_08110 [Thermoproteota archaeon]|nr:hypothetical protein [Thermoproteota archaeon]
MTIKQEMMICDEFADGIIKQFRDIFSTSFGTMSSTNATHSTSTKAGRKSPNLFLSSSSSVSTGVTPILKNNTRP